MEGGVACAASPPEAVILSKTSGVRRSQLSNPWKDVKHNMRFISSTLL
jgi:hypothetical protein